MALAERQELIRRLQKLRGSRLISHITSDRRTMHPVSGMSTQIAGEAHPFFVKVLRRAGRGHRKIDLFLYTRGGATDAVWPLVSLIREHCEYFSCLIPFLAHSGGTLIGLGADEIVMTERAELSPIDPTTGNQFNPVDPTTKAQLGISVEDVTAYIKLAKDKEKVGIAGEENILEVFKELTRQVHPLALGNVQRVHTQIRFLAEKLLSLHKKKLPEDHIPAIINSLVEGFHSHVHSINRREALSLLGDSIVKESSGEEAQLIDELFQHYEDLLNLTSTFSLSEYLGDRLQADLEVIGALIETEDVSFLFKTKLKVAKRSDLPPNIQVQVPPGQPVIVAGFPIAFSTEVVSRGWVENTEGT